MAQSWNNLALHGVDPSRNRQSDLLPYDETLSSSRHSFARWPSPQPSQPASQPSTSTAHLLNNQRPLLSPPPPSHQNSSGSLSQIIVPVGPLSPRGPLSPLSPASTLQSPRSPYSPGFQPLHRGQFPLSPVTASTSSDPFATPRTTIVTGTGTTASGSASSPRTRNSHGNLDAMLEQPYFDSPPTTGGLRATGNGTGTPRGGMEVEEPAEVGVRDGWRPAWLGHRVVGAFLGVFTVLAVVGEVVNWMISQKDWESSVQGLWTFGPVVVTSILAMLWARVEAQALLYTPWIILEGRPVSGEETRRKQARRTVLLDYAAMGSFKAITKGFRNRHHLVAASVSASLILRAQVVLSTGVFHTVVEADGTKYLRIRIGMLHAMAGLFCLLGGLLLPMLYHAPSKHGITARDPTSLAGTAALLASSRHFVARLNGTGSAPLEVVAAKLTGSWYTTELHQPGRKDGDGERFQLKQLSGGLPVSAGNDGSNQSAEWVAQYRPWTIGATAQVVGVAACAILLAGLWVIYALRGSGEGLKVSDSLFLVWTFIPTLIFTAFMVLWNRIDIDSRRLAPFLKLTVNKYRFKECLGLTYMNEFGLITAGKAMNQKDWGVVFKKAMAMLGWIMPIFTAGLFAITEVAQTANLHLEPQTQFVSTTKSLKSALDTDVVERVLIRETPSYPRWTYEGWAFPELALTDKAKEWPLPNTALTAKVTALQPVLDCETITLTEGGGADLKCSAIGGSSSEKTAICSNGTSNVGVAVSSCSGLASDYNINYIWGDCSDDGTISVMRCNESISQIDVSTTFHTEYLTIDTDAIPLADTSSQRDSDVEVDISSTYVALDEMFADNSTLEGLDGFFRTLVLSRLDMRLERLLAIERQNAVGVSIRLQHGIVGAQALNSDIVRRSISSSKLRARAGDSLIDATVDYYISRLTQSRLQTVVLAVLLSITLIFGVLALRTTHRGAPLPKDPCSIAAQASLLADSTLWWRLPPGAAWMDDEDLARCLRRKTFRLGWHNAVGGRVYGIGIVQDEGKSERPAAELSTSRTNTNSELLSGRYISMAPGLYSYGDIPVGAYEKE
ncbi:hypothetical protein B0T10DRAFT_403066 [Thelonectria olida]|uniref:Uncharacterized protein n=1 Tax=Thelonectria olida TaxID=1576542 RepID=A0A9P8W6N4_9HYPO|nr:hypothetical protein B0T10DRAFT_403066 [Thelonectria olida]